MNIGFILDYIYHGEVNIHQEHLDSFLESAHKLEISGLIGGKEKRNDFQEDSFEQRQPDLQTKVKSNMFKEESLPISDDNSSSLITTADTVVAKQRKQYSRAPTDDVPKIFVGNMTPEEIEAQTREMYYKNDGIWICHQCGKTSNVHCNMRYHVETHMDGLCYTCNICSKEFRSKNSFNFHKNTTHK